MSQKGNESISIGVDVSILSSVEEMVKKTLDKFGRIDILVNNAGITRDALVMRMKEEDWDLVLNINLKGAFNCIKVVSPVMMKQKAGKIVNIASIVGIIGNAGQANYSASKGGLIALTKTCARELAGRRINVNAVAPGFIQTSMTEQLPAQVKEKLSSQIPFGETGKPEDVASAVLFLVSEKASYITGEVIKVDGGMAM
ncbi:MAG: 3-oxoacyl-ACP reductase FabG [bacterium]